MMRRGLPVPDRLEPSIGHSNFNTTTVASSGSIPLALRETSSSKPLQISTAFLDQLGDFAHRLNRPRLVIRVHDRNQHRILAQTLSDGRRIDN